MSEEDKEYIIVIYPKRIGDLGGMKVSDNLLCKTPEFRNKLRKERAEEIKEEIEKQVGDIDIVDVRKEND